MTRPSRQHANVIRNRARMGHDEDQLARALGVTRETMRGWAKRDADFARALEDALKTSRDYWDRVDEAAQWLDKAATVDHSTKRSSARVAERTS